MTESNSKEGVYNRLYIHGRREGNASQDTDEGAEKSFLEITFVAGHSQRLGGTIRDTVEVLGVSRR